MAAVLAGTAPLARASSRQDLRKIAPWVGLISMLSASSVLGYDWIFPSASDRSQLAGALGGSPALSLVFGPARNLLTSDGFNAWRAGQLGALFAGVMTILIVVRNTRANEDSGQAELLASTVLARQSRLAVAVLLAWAASVALGVVCFVLTVACGGSVVPTLILSVSFAASGLMFASVAAVAAQLGSDAHAASSMSIAVLGVCYVVRGYVDSSGARDVASWLTPFGWLERTRPAAGNDPLPLLAAAAFTVVVGWVAFGLQARRDFGQGLIPARPGPAGAGRSANVWRLALRLNRGAIVSWLIGFAGLGLVFGNLATSLGDIVAANPAAAKILASQAGSAGATSAFLATILQVVAIVVAVMGVHIVLRVHTEESDHRVEPLLAGSLSRSKYLASNAVVALVGTAVAQLLAGVALGLVASAKDDSVSFGTVVEQSAVTVAAVWALVALALAVVGAAPDSRVIAWLGVVATFVLTLLGPTFRLPGWVLNISPLRQVPDVGAAEPAWSGLLWLTLVVVVLLAVAFTGYRRRSIL